MGEQASRRRCSPPIRWASPARRHLRKTAFSWFGDVPEVSLLRPGIERDKKPHGRASFSSSMLATNPMGKPSKAPHVGLLTPGDPSGTSRVCPPDPLSGRIRFVWFLGYYLRHLTTSALMKGEPTMTAEQILLTTVGVVVAVVLAATAAFVGSGARFRGNLRSNSGFSDCSVAPTWTGPFEYAASTDPILTEFRETYQLDRIAGTSSEIERLVRVMCWVHRLTSHAVNPTRPEEMTGLHLVRWTLEEGKRFNCWMYATVLNDALLSLGFASRLVHLCPHSDHPNESHYVTAVYSSEYKKWIHLDPDMCAYVTDEHGVPLGVGEIRERIIDQRPLLVSNTIDMAYTSMLGKPLVKSVYLWYLSKNLFRIACPARSMPGYETDFSGNVYVQLLPDGYHDEWLSEPRQGEHGTTFFCVRDPELFWAAPDGA